MFLSFDLAVQDIVGANDQRVRGQSLLALVVQAQGKAPLRVSGDLGHNIGRVFNFDARPVASQHDFILAPRRLLETLAEEFVDALILDALVVGIPPAIFSKVDCAGGVNGPETSLGHSCSALLTWPTVRGIENECHRAVVHELDCHMCLEVARGNRNTVALTAGDKIFIQRFGAGRSCRSCKRWAAAFARIAVQRELRHNQQCSIHVLD